MIVEGTDHFSGIVQYRFFFAQTLSDHIDGHMKSAIQFCDFIVACERRQ